MSKKYKHILLPEALFGRQQRYETNRNGRDIQNLPGFPNIAAHKRQLSSELGDLKGFTSEVQEKRKSDEDKKYAEVKIKFQGHANMKLLDRYQMDLYKKYDEKPNEQEYSNDVVIGRVSKEKLPSQNLSPYELFASELEGYISSNQLKSLFGSIEKIEPLNKEVVINREIQEELDAAGGKPILMDIIFGDNQEQSQIKMESISTELGDRFVAGINTNQVHYCRVIASKPEVENILDSYAGIIGVEEAPFVVFGSGVQSKMGKFVVEDLSQNKKPLIIFDHPVYTNHPIIKSLSNNPVGDAYTNQSEPHGTQVASLVIYGSKISQNGTLVGRNKILPVNIFPISNGQPIFNENVIIDILKKYSSPDTALIANLSINDYRPYIRKTIHRLTALFDELAVDYNCLFVISAGNLFKQWDPAEVKRIMSIGYPNYFKENITTILPPADSINNLTIGSVTYQASPNSLAPVGEPSPITRRGFTDTQGFYFIKPDLVEYDSNFDSNYGCEDNGPFMACPTDALIRAAGTSFSTPLATHALGVLSQMYPDYSVNTLKALIIHFAKPIASNIQVPPAIMKSLLGYGLPDVERALYSLNTSSTLVVEDKIKVGTSKRVKVPIPKSISGSNRKRLSVRKTLVYNPKINNIDVKSYNPILLSARIVRDDGSVQNNATSRRYQDGAHRKSNVKTYEPIERSTIDHMGAFWEVEVIAEPVNAKVADDIEQAYSIVLTIEDMQKDDSVDLHAEIQQMIEVQVGINVDVEVNS